MPCRNDYPDPTSRQIESRLVCQLLVQLAPKLGYTVEGWVKEGAKNEYGVSSAGLQNDATETLCGLCSGMTKAQQDKFIWDGKSKDARMLADWWEKHQEFDRLRAAQEKKEKAELAAKKKALSKLTPKEKQLLGL